jgi:predicted N-formylglutamate amidohydrolase
VARGLDYVELEVRQDLIAEPAGIQAAADLLVPTLSEALASLA